MRYIDADKAKEKLGVVRSSYSCFLEEDRLYYEVLSSAIKIINEQPTADVRENVSGEWIDRGKDMTIRWQCSECGRRDTHIYNFCPNCGADMRGDKQ